MLAVSDRQETQSEPQTQPAGWRACSGGILGGGLVQYPPLARAFTGRLTERAHMFLWSG